MDRAIKGLDEDVDVDKMVQAFRERAWINLSNLTVKLKHVNVDSVGSGASHAMLKRRRQIMGRSSIHNPLYSLTDIALCFSFN